TTAFSLGLTSSIRLIHACTNSSDEICLSRMALACSVAEAKISSIVIPLESLQTRSLTTVPSRYDGMEETPHPPSFVGHPLPWERAAISGARGGYRDRPLPWGEGGPLPALSPAGAGRVRDLIVGGAYTL